MREPGEYINTRNGFFSRSYYSTKKKKRVVAFRGTEPGDWKDLMTDVHIILRKNSEQFIKSLRQGLKFKNEVVYTGHSLGGALAKYVAAKYGYQAVAFNAPGIKGLNNLNQMHRNARIHNVNALFDPVSKYGEHFGTEETLHVGSIPFLPDVTEPLAVGASMVASQGMGAVAVGSYYLLGQHSISNLVIELQSRAHVSAANMPVFELPRRQYG